MLLEKIEADFQGALKAKDLAVVSTLRLLKSELVKKEKEGKELTEEMAVQILRSQIKQRQDSIVEYEKGGRADLAAKEKAELEILGKYLPPELPEEKIKEIIEEVLAGLPEDDAKNFGKVMGAVMAKTEKQASGGTVSRLLKAKLNNIQE